MHASMIVPCGKLAQGRTSPFPRRTSPDPRPRYAGTGWAQHCGKINGNVSIACRAHPPVITAITAAGQGR